MPGQNPYSPYLPANNPSIFPESKEEKKKSNLGAILGIGGAGLGLLFGGPAGMKTGMAVGSGIGGLFDNSGSPQSQMSSLQQVAGAMQSGERDVNWYRQANAKSAAAQLLGSIGG